jgi:8-amino-7-oxononanoate synthase
LREVEIVDFPYVRVNGVDCLNFSSNDYLGLASHPLLKARAKQAWEEQGAGSAASRLICGNLPAHQALDLALARFKGTEAALSFSSGFATALGTIPALVGPSDTVIVDKLSHACLIDAAKLSGAKLRAFPHNDLNYLEKILQKRPAEGNVLIVTESVFSMDGDAAPLRELVALKEKYGAWLMVDEAHSTGLYGEGGCGLVQAEGLTGRVDVQMGTLSKALGASGGFIAGSQTLIDYLINKARSFIFSTAPMPVSALVAQAAVQLVQTPTGGELRDALWRNVESLRKAWPPGLPEFISPILPWQVGDEAGSMKASTELLKQGFLIPAVRYPTVPRGQARLRVTASAAHSLGQIQGLLRSLRELDHTGQS